MTYMTQTWRSFNEQLHSLKHIDIRKLQLNLIDWFQSKQDCEELSYQGATEQLLVEISDCICLFKMKDEESQEDVFLVLK